MRESSAPHPCCLTPLWAFVWFQSCSCNAGRETEWCAVKQEEAPFEAPSCPPGPAVETSGTWQLHSLPVMLLSMTFLYLCFRSPLNNTFSFLCFLFSPYRVFFSFFFFCELMVESLRNSRKKRQLSRQWVIWFCLTEDRQPEAQAFSCRQLYFPQSLTTCLSLVPTFDLPPV